jgi:hypothetical protein
LTAVELLPEVVSLARIWSPFIALPGDVENAPPLIEAVPPDAVTATEIPVPRPAIVTLLDVYAVDVFAFVMSVNENASGVVSELVGGIVHVLYRLPQA